MPHLLLPFFSLALSTAVPLTLIKAAVASGSDGVTVAKRTRKKGKPVFVLRCFTLPSPFPAPVFDSLYFPHCHISGILPNENKTSYESERCRWRITVGGKQQKTMRTFGMAESKRLLLLSLLVTKSDAQGLVMTHRRAWPLFWPRFGSRTRKIEFLMPSLTIISMCYQNTVAAVLCAPKVNFNGAEGTNCTFS